MSVPSINVSKNASAIFSQIVTQANSYTNDFLVLAIMAVMSIIIYLSLSDKISVGIFGYSDARALAIGFGIASLFGLTFVSIGFTPNYYSIGAFLILFLLNLLFILIYENEE